METELIDTKYNANFFEDLKNIIMLSGAQTPNIANMATGSVQ